MFEWFRGRGNAETGPRDGEAPVLEQMALSETEAPAPTPASASVTPALGPRELQRDILLGRLSEKVLNVHLSNRFQTSFPLVLNFETLGSAGSELLAEVAAAATLSDPRTASQPDFARTRLIEAKAAGHPLSVFDEALGRPRALSLILADVVAVGLGSHAYAVSLVALGRPTSTGQHHLAYIAARLGLGEEMTASLRRRYRR